MSGETAAAFGSAALAEGKGTMPDMLVLRPFRGSGGEGGREKGERGKGGRERMLLCCCMVWPVEQKQLKGGGVF